MPRLGEREKLEIQLATYLEIAMISVDEETLEYVREKIAILEQRLRKMDEDSREH